MPEKAGMESEHIQYHKDGSVWAKGQMLDGAPAGYWEWFRKDGTKMRSGTFANGEQVGERTTYDRNGAVHKVTDMSRKKKSRKVAGGHQADE
jgi:antitoxin component YwqK of YwqJK toxin-antitoxin module